MSVLKLFAPAINARLAIPPEAAPDEEGPLPLLPTTDMQAAAPAAAPKTAQF